jgi:hypothetical protein
MLAHLRDLHAFYGEEVGVRVARKHIDWYAKGRPRGHALRHAVMKATDAQTQLERAAEFFDDAAACADDELTLEREYGAEKKNESSQRATQRTPARCPA